MARKKNLAVDLDGTLLEYNGYKGATHFGDPLPGMVDLLNKVKEAGWCIIIWTARRETGAMKEHLAKHNIPYDYINCHPWPKDGSNKVSADIYLDDRAINFDGKSEGLLEKILNFEPWYKNNEE